MEYVFGKSYYNGKEEQFVKTISDTEHSNFTEGRYITYVYENDNFSITYNFRILHKFNQDIDSQGKYQDWYYIDNFTKETNNLKPIVKSLTEQSIQLSDQSDVIDDILIELLKE